MVMNLLSDSETGMSPYTLHFGSKDADYFRLPEPLNKSAAPGFLRQFDEDLQFVRAKTLEFQKKLITKRHQDMDESNMNQYQPGDFVLLRMDPDKPLPAKFVARYQGPYEVISQYKNDVEVKHVVLGIYQTVHNDNLKIFHGNKEDAYKAAMLDRDQYEILEIIAHRGDPHRRTTMEFCIRFKDEPDNPRWRTWDYDLFASEPYAEYCRLKPSLFQLVYTVEVAKVEADNLNRQAITEVKPGDTVFVDLRWYGAEWYRQLNLPDKDFKIYVVPFIYESYKSSRGRYYIKGFSAVMKDRFTFDHVFVKEYGSVKLFEPASMILVNEDFIKSYPQIFDRSGEQVYKGQK
jgi:hypothetical protein